jgi:signal transduction histidine kinase
VKHLRASSDARARSTCTRTALTFAGGYCLVATAYICVSSALAARLSHDLAQLEAIETFKGIAFVAVTGLLAFALAFGAGRRQDVVAGELARCEVALAAAEARAASSLVVSTIAHDANNVLTALLGDLELAAAREPLQHGLDRRRLCIERLLELNRRLTDAAARRGARELVPIDVASVLRDHVAALRLHRALRNCAVELRCDDVLVLTTDHVLLLQIAGNLLVNAGEATDGHGTVRVCVERRAGEAVLEVHDDGPGIAPARRANLFEALESTKPGGAGLGLFSVNACAKSLGARVEVDDSPLGGALMRVRLPLP